ncbi:MAG TPA: hypothetical protein VFC19_01895 [Candidatus Limnocylindrales bacterium]|nr:hypothetical protein [Candidatus Limnocylindrales bacterium]
MPRSQSTAVDHGRLSSRLASCADDELAGLLNARPDTHIGVGGGSRKMDVNGTPIFVKRIPLTDLELEHPRSTANLFGLPLLCHYGIGSPGFGAWRELSANEIVTEAVLAGQTNAFPLLYHWRILPGRPPVAAEHADISATVAALGGSEAVRRRLEALAAASWSLVLFQEYLPSPLPDRLAADPVGLAASLELQLAGIVAFLRGQRLLHMDGHFGNMRFDGGRICLTDFGLATSPRFELSAPEREFAERHIDHDADYAAMVLVNWLVATVCGVPVPAERNAYVRRCAAGLIPRDVPPPVAAILARHAVDAAMMNDLYWRLFGGDVHAEYSGHQRRPGRRPVRSATFRYILGEM